MHREDGNLSRRVTPRVARPVCRRSDKVDREDDSQDMVDAAEAARMLGYRHTAVSSG